MVTLSQKVDPVIGNIQDIPEENITHAVAEKITARQKHETVKMMRHIGTIQAEQVSTDLLHRTRLLSEGSLTQEDMLSRNFENKSVMTTQALKEELDETRNDIKELIDSGNLSYREKVQFKDLLSLMNRYENKFSNDYGYNALLVGDMNKFAETLHSNITDRSYQKKFLENDHELAPFEKAGFKLTQMAHRINTTIDGMIDGAVFSVKERYYKTQDGILDGIDNTKAKIKDSIHNTNERIHEGFDNAKESVSNSIQSFRDKVKETLLRAKEVISHSANAAMFTVGLGYHLGKAFVEQAVQDTSKDISIIKEAVTDAAKSGYNKAAELTEKALDKTYDATVYTAAASIVTARMTGQAVKATGSAAVAGASRISQFIRDTKDKASTAIAEESESIKNKGRAPSI